MNLTINTATSEAMKEYLRNIEFKSGACMQFSLSLVRDNPGTKLVFGDILHHTQKNRIKHCWVECQAEGRDIVLSLNQYHIDEQDQVYYREHYYQNLQARVFKTYTRDEILRIWNKSYINTVTNTFVKTLPKKFRNVFKREAQE